MYMYIYIYILFIVAMHFVTIGGHPASATSNNIQHCHREHAYTIAGRDGIRNGFRHSLAVVAKGASTHNKPHQNTQRMPLQGNNHHWSHPGQIILHNIECTPLLPNTFHKILCVGNEGFPQMGP